MIPILNTDQLRAADQATISHEPIRSIDLMERAAGAFVNRFVELIDTKSQIKVFCGTGNNGGDGLAISRMLKQKGFHVDSYIIGDMASGSHDFNLNLHRIETLQSYCHIITQQDFPTLNHSDIVIDAIFGTGLSRPVHGLNGELINAINQSSAKIYSVDIASGLFADKPIGSGSIIRPKATISFQTPKLAFLQPTLQQWVGEWYIEDIGLDEVFIEKSDTSYYFTQEATIKKLFVGRNRFVHKGQVGKLQLVAGSQGKVGAAVLSAKAALRSGIGLLSVHIPQCGIEILQTSIPEAMASIDKHKHIITEVDLSFDADAIGLGPGIGTAEATVTALGQLLESSHRPMVIDADGLNILAKHPSLLEKLPPNSLLTPHPVEFQRLVGRWDNDYEKLALLRRFCIQYQLCMVLKGAFSAVCDSTGIITFNPTGNPGMATAGSGDVLTGIVSSLLAQGHKSIDALRIAVYIHGLAGDLVKEKLGERSLMASDLIDALPDAFQKLERS